MCNSNLATIHVAGLNTPPELDGYPRYALAFKNSDGSVKLAEAGHGVGHLDAMADRLVPCHGTKPHTN